MDPEPGNYALADLLLNTVFTPALIGEFILFVVLLMISFLASGSEVAFFSMSKVDIEGYRHLSDKHSQRIWELINKPKRLLATILITNNFVNVAAILVATHIVTIIGDALSWGDTLIYVLNVLLVTALLLFFGEIIPKVYASRNGKRILLLSALPLDFLRRVFAPLSQVLISSTRFIDKRITFHEGNASIEDLRHAIEITSRGEENNDEKEILKGIVNFKSIPVKQVMRARVDVEAVDVQIPLEELIEYINKHNHSRMPVFEDNLDKVIGILHIKDLIPYLRKDPPPFDLRTLVRKVHFVPESKKIDVLLEEFKSRREHLAVVVDEFGGTAGIVTLEDVIEEIFGEINDEFDSDDWIYTKVSDNKYVFEGRIALNDIKRILSLPDDIFEDARGDSDTLGGLILELHGKIPEQGEMIPYKNFEMHVESVSKNRINMVKFVIGEPQPENED